MFKTKIDNLSPAAEDLRDKWLRSGAYEQGHIFGAVMQQISDQLAELREEMDLVKEGAPELFVVEEEADEDSGSDSEEPDKSED